MNQRLFALFGAALLAGVALGPAMAAAQSETAGNDSVNEDDSFGLQVSAFIDQLQNSTNGTGIGHAVSAFVVANNPGNAPAFAGGPNATENGTQGPPAFVQSLMGEDDADNETDDRRGPPAHAGGPEEGDDDFDGNETEGEDDADANETADDDREPPEDAGGDDDGDDEDGDDRQGPPDDAGNGEDEADTEDE